MKKILFLISAVLITGSAFAQKNTISENIGVVLPISQNLKSNQSCVVGSSFGVTFQHGEKFNLMVSLNIENFRLNDDDLQYYADNISAYENTDVTCKANGSKSYNLGVGLGTNLELGRSGFFISPFAQCLIGLYQDYKIDCNIDTYDLERIGYFQVGGNFGLDMYKMFSDSFGMGIKINNYIGLPTMLNDSWSDVPIDYMNIQLKFVQKF